MSPQPRFYLCNGMCVTPDRLSQYPEFHIIGKLQYVSDEGHLVPALAIYDQSIPTAQWADALASRGVQTRVLIIGDARKIQCTCCNLSSRWETGKAAFNALVRRHVPSQRVNA